MSKLPFFFGGGGFFTVMRISISVTRSSGASVAVHQGCVAKTEPGTLHGLITSALTR